MDRNKRVFNNRRMPGALLDEEMNEYSDDHQLARQIKEERMRMLKEGMGVDMGDDDDQEMDPVDYEDIKGKLSIWLRKGEIIKWIKKMFTNFIRSYKDE